jgi:hypothetical protein
VDGDVIHGDPAAESPEGRALPADSEARPDPTCPLGVWLGWHLHARRDQRQLYCACYVLLTVTALKLLWDGLRGYGLV